MAPPEGADAEQSPQRENRGRTEGEGPRCPQRGRAPVPSRAPPPPPRPHTRGRERFPWGEVSYLWAAQGSLCRNISPWQVAAAPASPLPAGGAASSIPGSGAGSRARAPGRQRRDSGRLVPCSPPAFVTRISSRPRGRTQRSTAPCPLNPAGLLIIVAPLKGVRATGAGSMRKDLGNRHPT